jgi:hypothetical protein
VTSDRQTAANLLSYAADLETQAAKLEPLSSQAMEASGEPSSTQAMAALKTEVPEQPE